MPLGSKLRYAAQVAVAFRGRRANHRLDDRKRHTLRSAD